MSLPQFCQRNYDKIKTERFRAIPVRCLFFAISVLELYGADPNKMEETT
jgi:hypothetical protein